jgi:hypothetical protein
MSASFDPYKGVLHRSVGGDIPQSRRWTGSAFERLSDQELQEFRGAFRYSRDLLSAEGWSRHESITTFEGTEKSYPIRLRGKEFLLRVTKPLGDSGQAQQSKDALRITLAGPKEPMILYDLDQSWRRVDRQAYFGFKRPAE